MLSVLSTVGTVVLYLAALAMTLLVVYYHLSARWWTTPEGRHIMSWSFSMAVILDYLAVYTAGAFGELPLEVRAVVRIAIYGSLLALGVSRLILIIRYQRPAVRAAHRK